MVVLIDQVVVIKKTTVVDHGSRSSGTGEVIVVR
jgi:hypothetical protein